MTKQPLFALIASLPFLRMREKPQLSHAAFLESAAAFVGGRDLEELAALSLVPADGRSFRKGSFAAKYTAWEYALRQSIQRLRTAKFHLETASPVRREPAYESDADGAAVRAYAAADPLERERILDAARWDKAEELTVGHTFDFDVVEAYAVKLQIAEKWAKRSAGDPEKNLDSSAAALE